MNNALKTDLVQPSYPSERLAYWYFRLNGFLTIENFLVHPDKGSNPRTDADLLAVRFANRAENLVKPMEDDPKVASCPTFANIIIAEVKTSDCSLNGPWTDPKKGNMRRVLKAVGCVPDSAVDIACHALYANGFWSDAMVTIRLFAIGEVKDSTLRILETQQLTWDEVISFCMKRFKEYNRQKSANGQWTADGKILRDYALSRANPAQRIRQAFGLRQDVV